MVSNGLSNAITRRLILVGGSVRAAAEDAVRAGFQVLAIDLFGDADLLAACSRRIPLDDAALEQAITGNCPGWEDAPVLPTGGIESRLMRLIRGNPAIAAGWNDRLLFPNVDNFIALRNPQRLKEIASQCGLAFPDTFAFSESLWEKGADPLEASHVHEVFRLAGEGRPPFPIGSERQNAGLGEFLIKPRYGCGGIGIRELDWETDGDSHSPPEVEPPEVELFDVQRRVAGRPFGVNFLARRLGGRHHAVLLGVFRGLTYRRNPRSPLLYRGSVGPLPLADDEQRLLLELGCYVAERFRLVGLFNIDLLQPRHGPPVLLEINPRYSASMELLTEGEFLATGTGHFFPARSLPAAHVEAYREVANTYPDAGPDCHFAETARAGCKMIVYAEKATASAELLAAVARVPDGDVTFHDLPTAGQVISAGRPLLSIIARAADPPAALRSAHAAARQLRRL